MLQSYWSAAARVNETGHAKWTPLFYPSGEEEARLLRWACGSMRGIERVTAGHLRVFPVAFATVAVSSVVVLTEVSNFFHRHGPRVW